MNKHEKVESDIEKLKLLIPYWISHNNEHIKDNGKWISNVESLGLNDAAFELKEATQLLKEANKHIELVNNALETKKLQTTSEKSTDFKLKQIGIIRTPYTDNTPYQPVEDDKGDFRIAVNPEYTGGLNELGRFHYIYIIYYMHHVKRGLSMMVSPPRSDKMVGVFASRSPVRPNCIGLSIVRVKKIVNNEIFTSGIDVFDETPLIDIKPYIKKLDSKPDANDGWIEHTDSRQ
ncbi:MAG: tRNA (N6-threonylcarbamoyladenosine(37)-N6)-methyltransferase TrmO [Methanosarcinales archaeon]|nr:MAG: tRNA (N6-threonylcarbamoyladenosine(37)-N6)-methyltransferase TrmO [Methanosarcinales archaeon]